MRCSDPLLHKETLNGDFAVFSSVLCNLPFDSLELFIILFQPVICFYCFLYCSVLLWSSIVKHISKYLVQLKWYSCDKNLKTQTKGTFGRFTEKHEWLCLYACYVWCQFLNYKLL